MSFARWDADAFAAWRHAVDRTVWVEAGVGLEDLPDCPLADWYMDDVTPAAAARRALDLVRDIPPHSRSPR